jgi:hypothetical protein
MLSPCHPDRGRRESSFQFRPRSGRTAQTSEHDIHIVARTQSAFVFFFAHDQNFSARDHEGSARRARSRAIASKKSFRGALLRDILQAISLLHA